MTSRAIVTLRVIGAGSKDLGGAAANPLLFDLFGLRELSNLAASVEALGGDMMSSMHLPGNRVDRQRRPLQGIMCSTHITPGRRLA
jgi:hypothetical protein